MLEKEMISLFSNTFKAPYFEYLVRSSAQHFADLVVTAERIEQAIGLGKIADPTEKNGFTEKGKDTEGVAKALTVPIANFFTPTPRNQLS
jgi:hypothetical protein